MSVTRQAALDNLLWRREMRRSFLSWCCYLGEDRGELPAAHHRLVIDTLQKVSDGILKRVIILMPPGAAKSTYVSKYFIPWHLASHPTDLFLACSYAKDLVMGFGKACREIIKSHSTHLGYALSDTSQAADDWRITKGTGDLGGYFCAGVGAGIAGYRADVGVIDDYLGSQEDADSSRIREKQWDWYNNDFWPRLKPQASQFIIANRRHEEDLVGMILKREAEKWTVIRLPFFAEADDPIGRPPAVRWDAQTEKMIYDVKGRLWPEWYTEEQAQQVMTKDSRTLSGLWQQRPAPEEGSFFKRSMLQGYTREELEAVQRSGLRFYVGSDFAARAKETNDRTCFLPAGVDNNDNLWILPNWFWDRCDADVAIEQMLLMSKTYRPIVWWCGKEQISASLEPFILKRMRETGIYIPTEEVSEYHDKLAKAQPIRARMSQKKVLFPKFANQWNEAEAELLMFPGGGHDDFVDALAKLGQGLGDIVAPSKPRVQTPFDLQTAWKPTLPWLKASDKVQRRNRMKQLCNLAEV